ncbi:tRNA U-34 5-methylaminomethyl-2-thiouridine biosynthesis protein MnmC [Burkholderiales bacterium JOSHI_001]|nr:tRNA U-34 5-methylaminomethyl-2-thiouridine biosynthesis protein MnmC [Burkholderiales bacterium JOSHI_001]
MPHAQGHLRVPFVMGRPLNEAPALAPQQFLASLELPLRWRGRARFVVLDTGFDTGHNFLATWAAWRDDPQRPARLWFLAMDTQPPCTGETLQRAHTGSAWAALADELLAAWPPATPDIHRLVLDAGRVTLLLARGDAATMLPQWVAQVDALCLRDKPPGRAPRLARLAAPGATLLAHNTDASLREQLARDGFDLREVPGHPDHAAFTTGRFAPRFQAAPPPGRQAAAPCRSAIVIGAGLAGAATAHALAAQGVACTVLDAAPGPAQRTSGNAGGLFHGVVHAGDAPHARWFRACALLAERTLRPLVKTGQLPGAVDGLLRLEPALDLVVMQERLARAGLPADHVQALDGAAARALAGLGDLPGAAPGWFYPGGGWVSPAALTALLLQGEGIRCHFNAPVQQVAPRGGAWQAEVAGGDSYQADVLVLANAHDAARLAAPFCGNAWPATQRARGQVSLLPPSSSPGGQLARPLAGAGYALSLPDGTLLCGATTQDGDDDCTVREADHRINLDRLAQLTGWPLAGVDAATLPGRVGWRLLAPDRLPLLGPVPAATAGSARLDQPRRLPRVPGLYVHTALGSRGIAQSLLGAQVLASWISGAPVPLASALLDAVDVARFTARAARAARQS